VFTSLVVVWHLRPHPDADLGARTSLALKLIAGAFLVLAVGLSAVSISDLVTSRRPEETAVGIAMMLIVAIVKSTLAFLKRGVAERLDSAPLRAQATMSMLDGCLALATLTAWHCTPRWGAAPVPHVRAPTTKSLVGGDLMSDSPTASHAAVRPNSRIRHPERV